MPPSGDTTRRESGAGLASKHTRGFCFKPTSQEPVKVMMPQEPGRRTVHVSLPGEMAVPGLDTQAVPAAPQASFKGVRSRNSPSAQSVSIDVLKRHGSGFKTRQYELPLNTINGILNSFIRWPPAASIVNIILDFNDESLI